MLRGAPVLVVPHLKWLRFLFISLVTTVFSISISEHYPNIDVFVVRCCFLIPLYVTSLDLSVFNADFCTRMCLVPGPRCFCIPASWYMLEVKP